MYVVKEIKKKKICTRKKQKHHNLIETSTSKEANCGVQQF